MLATIVATCSDIPEFGADRLASRAWASRFIGAGWVAELYPRASLRGWIAASGDVALEKVHSGEWAASDILVVQELGARQGRRLVQFGAIPLLLTCMESPLYAPLFYDRLSSWSEAFPYVMAPGPSQATERLPRKSHLLRFPCYWEDEITPPRPWRDRREVVLLAGNKYWSTRTPLPLSHPRRLLSAIRHEARLAVSPTRRMAAQIQLHDDRFRLIAGLSKQGLLDVYGAGWADLSHLPEYWRDVLGVADLHVMGPVSDKTALQSQYKFALCVENARFPGYVTEKIIQCLVSGTIPIYLGAPDIAEFVPAAAFIDVRALPTFDDLPALLLGMGESTALGMLRAGREFLASPVGRRHSYSGFAEWVLGLGEELLRDRRR